MEGTGENSEGKFFPFVSFFSSSLKNCYSQLRFIIIARADEKILVSMALRGFFFEMFLFYTQKAQNTEKSLDIKKSFSP